MDTATNSTTIIQADPVVINSPAPKNQDELERVRELILGPDKLDRLAKSETDRLREIIFGTHMQEYDRHFADMRREMERVLGDLRTAQERALEFEREQTRHLEALERDMQQAYDELRREVTRLRNQEATLQQVLTQVRQQELLHQNTAEHANELNKGLVTQERDLRSLKTTVSEHRDNHERKLETLKREVRQNVDDLRAELRRLIDRLDSQKTDRKALAAMLIEVATRLETGSNVTGLLKELSAPTQE
jgi:chromosome segregation ATPase